MVPNLNHFLDTGSGSEADPVSLYLAVQQPFIPADVLSVVSGNTGRGIVNPSSPEEIFVSPLSASEVLFHRIHFVFNFKKEDSSLYLYTNIC